jgi:hypothetical protein
MRPLSDAELITLVIRQWEREAPPAPGLLHTGVFLWVLLAILILALAMDAWVLSRRLEQYCNDLARPRAHIECAYSGEGEADGEGQDVRHAADADPANRSRP